MKKSVTNTCNATWVATNLSRFDSSEELEKMGQQELLESDVLPSKMQGGSKEDFEKLGIAFDNIVADDLLFIFCTLPEGWKKVPESPNDFIRSYLVDEQGNKRVFIYYSAAFDVEDRIASMRLLS